MSFTIQDALTELSRQRDNLIVDQLNQLIAQGLLIVECTQPVLVRDSGSDTVRLTEAVRLKLRDQEIIDELRNENARLKEDLAEFKQFIKKMETYE